MKRLDNIGAAALSGLALMLLAASCMPNVDDNSSGNGGGTGQEVKPTPEGVKQIELSTWPGDELAGIHLSTDGVLEAARPSEDWYFASVGTVPGLGNVDYIPKNNWDTGIRPDIGLGFVGYSPREGFVRFMVGLVVLDASRVATNVGLYYLGNFLGKDEPLPLKDQSFVIGFQGGTVKTTIEGRSYAPYDVLISEPWLTGEKVGTVYSFIYNAVEITVEPNPTAEVREASVRVKTHSGNQTIITVVQDGNPSVDPPTE